MKVYIYNTKDSKRKILSKKETFICLPSNTPGFSRHPYVQIIVQNIKRKEDIVIDIPVKEIRSLTSQVTKLV